MAALMVLHPQCRLSDASRPLGSLYLLSTLRRKVEHDRSKIWIDKFKVYLLSSIVG